MELLANNVRIVPALFLALIALEVFWALRRKRSVFNAKEVGANVFIAAVTNLLRPLTLAWQYAVFSLLEPLQLYPLPKTAAAFLFTFLAADFAYYCYHRLAHSWAPMWTMHHTHHSSRWMNLTTAVRLNWVASFVSPLFFAPLILLGMSAEVLATSLGIGLLYQFVLHSEAVPRLGGFEGKLLNTPSAHRVHHGCNQRYIDRNFAGVFIFWDRLFGTYETETDDVRYGVTVDSSAIIRL